MWESVRLAVSRVKIGSRVIRWKDDQRIQELKDVELIARRQPGECVTRILCLLAVAEDDFSKVNATPVMSVRSGSTNSPQRRCQEFLLPCPVVVSLLEVRAKIVTLEVGENIFHQERLVCWLLQRRKPTVVVVRREEHGGCPEQVIEDSVFGVINRFQIRDSAIVVDLKVRDVTLRASYLLKFLAAGDHSITLLVWTSIVDFMEFYLLNYFKPAS